MRYLAGEELLIMHSELIDATGGLHGVREVGLLASIIQKPQMTVGGHEAYPTLHDKAAVYLEAFARYHVFVDGNKRTALIASARFLHLNSWQLTATNQVAESFVLSVASDKLVRLSDITAWLKRYSKKV